MRRLSLDIGDVRIGVAISDPSGSVATPLTVLDARSLRADLRPLLRLMEDYEVGLVVAGLPLGMSGTEGPQARAVRTTVEWLRGVLPVPIELWDERLSSAEARRVMSESGVSDRKKRGSVDKLAAAIFLQSYLDAHRGASRDGGTDE